MVAITSSQLEALKSQLEKLFSDKAQADVATNASNEADGVLAKAAQDAQGKEIIEGQADDQVNKTILDLQTLVNSLVASKLTKT